MSRCKICGKHTKEKGLWKHIMSAHHMSTKQYYDSFLKQEGEGICLVCGKETKLISLKEGYRKYCSVKCANTDNPMHKKHIVDKVKKSLHNTYKLRGEDINKQRQETYKKRTGFSCPSQNPEVREKVRQTCIKRFGKESFSQTPNFKEKVKAHYQKLSEDKKQAILAKRIATCRRKYGKDFVSQVPEVIQKIQETIRPRRKEIAKKQSASYRRSIEERGDEIEKKRIATNLKRFGVQHAIQNPEIKEKMRKSQRKTTLKRYRTILSKLGIELITKPESIMDPVTLYCKEHKKLYTNTLYNILMGGGRCPICKSNNLKTSKGQEEITNFIRNELQLECSINCTELIKNPQTGRALELDIFIHNKKFAIEFNGLYWHSDEKRDKNYHLLKYRLCKEKGIRLLQLFEDEWCLRKDIVKSMITNFLRPELIKPINARDCHVSPISPREKSNFLNQNHLQGNDSSSVKLGLFKDKELVAVMTFSHGSISSGKLLKENEWVLSRFCSLLNTRVRGGASKLLSYFKKKYEWSKIITYANLRYSDGELYRKLGFQLCGEIEPDYFYTKLSEGLIRIHRFKLRKKPHEPKDVPEWQLRLKEGYGRIWDAGKLRFILRRD